MSSLAVDVKDSLFASVHLCPSSCFLKDQFSRSIFALSTLIETADPGLVTSKNFSMYSI